MIKIAIAATYPAASVLEKKDLKARFRQTSNQHPAPWVRALCQELSAKDGVAVEVFSHSYQVDRTKIAEKEGVRYTFVPKYEPRRADPYHLYFPALLQILPMIRRFNPDIVHGFGTENANGLLAALYPGPNVVFIQGIQEKLASFYDMPKPKIALRKMLERYVVRSVDGLIAETQFACKWAKSVRKDADVKIIPHAYTKEFFQSQPDFRRRRIICIGALSRIKGCTTVLEAYAIVAKRNPGLFLKSELLFIGDGPYEGLLEKMAEEKELSPHVRFLGRIAHENILFEMEKACSLVIGSRMDTSPNVVTEAHAAGLPVIGTNAGGIPDMIVDGKDGFVVPVDDADAMSQRMELLLSNLGRCAEMGNDGRKKVISINDPSRIADAHIDFYNEILAGYSK